MNKRTACDVVFALVGVVCVLPTIDATVVDLTHIYGSDVLYPPVGHGSFNFTIMHRGYEPSLDHWYVLM